MAGPSPFLHVLGVPVSIDVDGAGDRAVVERFGPGGMEADVMFKCPYNQRFTVIKGLLGGSVNSGGTVSYWRPIAYPPLPQLFCTAVGDVTGIKPFTDSFGWLNYEYVRFPAHFSVPSWDAISGLPSPDPSGVERTTTRFRVSAEVFSPPIGAFYYVSGTYAGKPVPEAHSSVVRPKVEIVMTRRLLPFVPLAAALRHVGKVNDDVVRVADFDFPRGCVLFAGIDTDPTSDPSTGTRAWDVPFTFLANHDVQWNEVLAPDDEYVLINDAPAGTGNYPYDYVSFDTLFGNVF